MGWGGPTCSNSQRAPEEMKTSILTQLRIPFPSSGSFSVSCCSSCSVQTHKQIPPRVQVGRSNLKQLSPPDRDARTEGQT